MSEDIEFSFRDKEQEEIPKEFYVGQIVVCVKGHIDGFMYQDKTYCIVHIETKYHVKRKEWDTYFILSGRDYQYLSVRFRAATKKEQIIYLKQQRDERHKR